MFSFQYECNLSGNFLTFWSRGSGEGMGKHSLLGGSYLKSEAAKVSNGGKSQLRVELILSPLSVF